MAVVATAGMGNGPADADRPHADPPDRLALASSTWDAMVSPGERESLAGTTTEGRTTMSYGAPITPARCSSSMRSSGYFRSSPSTARVCSPTR